jgi:hypothetical protein
VLISAARWLSPPQTRKHSIIFWRAFCCDNSSSSSDGLKACYMKDNQHTHIVTLHDATRTVPRLPTSQKKKRKRKKEEDPNLIRIGTSNASVNSVLSVWMKVRILLCEK